MLHCFHCDDPLLPGEKLLNFPPGDDESRRPMHVECVIRIIFGSAAHQLRECSCFGGDREEPAGLTRRQCAQLAVETFKVLRGDPAPAVEVYQ